MQENNNVGAVSALKGYRAQFIYCLYRILFPAEVEASFQPEGKFEDLDVFDENGNVTEIAQVKRLSTTLTLSDIVSKKSNSFLKRASAAHENGYSPKITLVSFGPLNDEVKALAQDQFSNDLLNKLKGYGLNDKQIQVLQKHFSYQVVDEDTLTSQVVKKIEDLKIYIDTQVSLDLLIYWMYNAALSQRVIQSVNIQSQLIAIGKFQSDRLSFHNTFGTLIRPLNQLDDTHDIKKLQSDFYQGISANYNHILAGIDIVRPDKLVSINEKFRESNTVFIHGASGQGKSTLAYRYLHDYCPTNAAFILSLPADVATIYEIVNSLNAISLGIEFPVTLYIDVIPGNTDWITVLQELGTKKNLNFLLTIREEDWNSFPIDDKFTYADIELGLNESEAELIYKSLNSFDLDLKFTDFQDAWDVFGESGPLLEFVYLVTQGESLLTKLKSQVDRIVDNSTAIAKDKVKLLRFVVLADCFSARVTYREIALYLKLENISRLTELLEREYLLKVSDGKSFISGLHPVRSELLKKFLFDPEIHKESEFVLESLHFLDPATIDSFLRNAFRYTKLDASQLLDKLKNIEINSWTSYNAIQRSLIWRGVSDFVDRNQELLQYAFAQFGRGWIAMVNVDISKALEGENITELGSLFSEEQREIARDINSKLTGAEDIYKDCRTWISTISQIAIDPVTEGDFKGLASFVFWLDHLNIGDVQISISAESIQNGFKKHTLDVLSRTLLAIKKGKGLESHRAGAQELFLERFFKTHNVIALKESDKEIVCQYYFNLLENPDNQKYDNFIHEKSIQVVNQLRFAYPDKEIHGTDGYGHKVSFIPDMHDDSHKRIPRRNIPIDYLVEINSTFINLFDFSNRVNTWSEYVDRIIERRSVQVGILEKQIEAFSVYHKKKNFSSLIEFLQKFWATHNPALEKHAMPSLPKVIMNEWGLSGEGNKVYEAINTTAKKAEHRKALSLKRYEAYKKFYNDYDGHITNYLQQSTVQIAKVIRTRTGQKTGEYADYSQSSLVGNLFKAHEITEQFQDQFRQHFTKFVSSKELSEIEQKEKTYIAALCFIYRHFIFSESFLSGNVLKIASSHLKQVQSSFVEKVTAEIKSLSKRIDCSLTIEWDENSKRIIVLARGDSSLKIYGSIDQIYTVFHTSLNKPEYTSLKYAVLAARYKSVFVVPINGTNSINGKWYEFKFDNLVNKKFHELEQFSLLATDIPDDIRSRYDIQTWNAHLSDFGKLERLVLCASTAYQLAYHFGQFLKFDGVDLEDRGEKILQAYLSSVVEKFQSHLQEALDLYSYFIECCNEGVYTFPNETEKMEIYQFLLSTHKFFSPTDDEAQDSSVERAVSENQMEVWIPRLEQLSNNMGLIYFVFSDRIIAKHRATG